MAIRLISIHGMADINCINPFVPNTRNPKGPTCLMLKIKELAIKISSKHEANKLIPLASEPMKKYAFGLILMCRVWIASMTLCSIDEYFVI